MNDKGVADDSEEEDDDILDLGLNDYENFGLEFIYDEEPTKETPQPKIDTREEIPKEPIRNMPLTNVVSPLIRTNLPPAANVRAAPPNIPVGKPASALPNAMFQQGKF